MAANIKSQKYKNVKDCKDENAKDCKDNDKSKNIKRVKESKDAKDSKEIKETKDVKDSKNVIDDSDNNNNNNNDDSDCSDNDDTNDENSNIDDVEGDDDKENGSERVDEQDYNEEIRIPHREKLHCEHDRRPDRCRDCTEPKFKCCGYEFLEKYRYDLHLKSEKHRLSSEQLKEVRSKRGKAADEDSKIIEEFITAKIGECPDIEFVERIGNTANKFDILFKLYNESCHRVIQVKKLGKTRYRNCYTVKLKKYKRYEDDTLIVGANLDSERKVYYAIPYSKVKNRKSATLSFSGKRKSYIYDNEEKFKQALFKKMRATTILKDNDVAIHLNKTAQQEYYSFKRLNKICDEYKDENGGLVYKRNSTNISTTDIFINDRPIQCKSISVCSGTTYHFSIVKRKGYPIQKRIPYEDKDLIHFFIFEITFPKYQNRFYVFPVFVLIDRGYIKTDTQPGKQTIRIAPPDYKGKHWTLEFLDKLCFINKKELDPLLGKSDFEKACLRHELEFKKSFNAKNEMVVSSVEGESIRFIHCAKTKNDEDMYDVQFRKREYDEEEESNSQKIYEESDKIDVFVIEVNEVPGEFCIIPSPVLIDRGYMATGSQRGKKELPIIHPRSKKNHWSKYYWNNFFVFSLFRT